MAENTKKMANIIDTLETFFKQAPNLPENAREVLVKVAPWLALIFGILGIIGGINLLGFSPFAMLGGIQTSFSYMLVGVVTIIASALILMAYPKLVKREYKGWELLFWSEAVSVLSVVITINVLSILLVLVGFYLLFQIKRYYK